MITIVLVVAALLIFAFFVHATLGQRTAVVNSSEVTTAVRWPSVACTKNANIRSAATTRTIVIIAAKGVEVRDSRAQAGTAESFGSYDVPALTATQNYIPH